MQHVITPQQLTEQFELLDPTQQQTVYEFMLFILSRHRGQTMRVNKDLLWQTSVWTEQDIQRIDAVQQELKTWPIPTLS